MKTFAIGDRVKVLGIDERGKVLNIRFDDRNEAIYTIELDWAMLVTPDGLYVARGFELESDGAR